jgi:hypothetical protein
MMISAPLTAREDGIAGLRAQLADMAAVLIERLCGRIEGGSLALLGSVGALLDALDHQLPPGEASPATRAVVSDDGREITLTLYGEAGIPAVAVVLGPARAVALAGELIASALPRLR